MINFPLLMIHQIDGENLYKKDFLSTGQIVEERIQEQAAECAMEKVELPSRNQIKEGKVNFLRNAIRITSVQYVTVAVICGLRYLVEKRGNLYTK